MAVVRGFSGCRVPVGADETMSQQDLSINSYVNSLFPQIDEPWGYLGNTYFMCFMYFIFGGKKHVDISIN